MASISASDSAVKQILITMNEKDPFIIEDLDDYHLVIKADDEYRVRKELEAEVNPVFLWGSLTNNIWGQLEKNTYSFEAT